MKQLKDLIEAVTKWREGSPAKPSEADESCSAAPVIDLVRNEPTIVNLTVAVRIEAIGVGSNLTTRHDEGEGVQQ